MSDINYNQAILIFANAGLAALAESADTSSSLKTPAGESHFLCSWMVTALKKRSFSKLLAEDLTFWIRQARSMGANAELKLLLQKISQQYTYIADKQQGLGLSLKAMLAELESSDWLIITDQEVTKKLKLNSDGNCSLIISDEQFTQRIDGDELIKPITFYVRAPEQAFAEIAYKHNLLLSAGNKKTSLIKHHKTYRIWPKNVQPALTILQPLSDS
ncbi:hypothetical protein CXF83_05555 [Shewanella sp. Choline-02u-19]|uniref:DUF2913 family protein n=1 Tax=unclassified Shewanella TaxID=196818 RepID=UPI000C31CBD7|nr:MULTISPECIES: DUF2913 family protein [unclassified Shewanella]PKH56313.1 hypothetical protein CXF84_14225 [Shewanella sp. Bg11-22]PKI30107.1 hypothetical protein CXF83_05555 [Shewanella sp. Choline-02u-19]